MYRSHRKARNLPVRIRNISIRHRHTGSQTHMHTGCQTHRHTDTQAVEILGARHRHTGCQTKRRRRNHRQSDKEKKWVQCTHTVRHRNKGAVACADSSIWATVKWVTASFLSFSNKTLPVSCCFRIHSGAVAAKCEQRTVCGFW